MIKKIFASLVVFFAVMTSVNAQSTLTPVNKGGTGSSTLTGILIGNGISSINTLIIGSGLNLSGTTLTAPGGGGGSSFGNPFNYVQASPNNYLIPTTTTTGLLITASSTIGDSLNGLTTFGNSTTTGKMYIGSSLSNYVSISGSNANPSISVLGPVATSTDLMLAPLNNGQVIFGGGGWGYNTQSSGKDSILFNNGNADTPNLKFAYGSNINIGLDAFTSGNFGTLSGEFLRFIKNSDETGGSVIAGIDTSGNASFLGQGYFGGNLGIASATPDFPLSISHTGTANLDAIDLLNNQGGANDKIFEHFTDGGGTGGTIGYERQNSASGDFTFDTSSTFTGTLAERMRITAAGKVAIGTTTPASLLDLYAAGSSGVENDVLTLEAVNNTIANGDGTGILLKTSLNNGSSGINTANAARIYTYLTSGAPASENDQLRFQTQRTGTLTDAMTIDSTGNAGFGTSTPAQSLYTTGAIGIGSGGSNSPTISTSGVSPNQNLVFTAGGTGSNIFTATPNTNLSQANTFNNNSAIVTPAVAYFLAGNTTASGSAGSGPFSCLGVTTATQNCATLQFNYTGSGSAANYFGIGMYGTASIFNVLSGNVNIGTTTDPDRFAVQNGNSSTDLGASGSLDGIAFNRTFNTGAITTNTRSAFQITDNASSLVTSVYNGSGSSADPNAFVVASNGSIGISTSTPSNRLDVDGSALFEGGQNDIELRDYNVANADWALYAQISNTTKLFRIFDVTSNANRLVIDANGNVGISTTSPSAILAVQGNSFVSGTSTAGNFLATSTVTIPNLGIAAGQLAAYDPTGKLIGTSTPGGGGTTPTAKTLVPEPNYNLGGQSNGMSLAGNTTAHFGQIVIPFQMVLNEISIPINSVSTAGTVKIGLYSENGQTQIFNVTTASITGSGNIVTVLGSSVTVPAGVYYIGVVPVGTANILALTYTQDGQTNAINNTAGKPVLEGTLTVTASTLPATFTPSSITSATLNTIVVRFDN